MFTELVFKTVSDTMYANYLYVTFNSNLSSIYTEANPQRNTDFGVHLFLFIFIKLFFCGKTLTITKIWLRRRKKVLGHERSSTGLLDENRNSCCTWNWLILYGNNVCHSTVHWLSIDSVNHFFLYLVFKNMLKYADEQMDFGRRYGCPVVGIVRSLPYQECGRNITNNVRWWMCI